MANLSYIVVEDNPEFALLLQKYLERIPDLTHLGTYGGTTDAVLNIERQKPDVLFLDINISGLEGPEFMELVDFKPKVIIVSGHSEDIMNNYDIEYVDFIQKPPTLDRLIDTIEKCR
jgi:two-component system LytT family response regulator